MRTGQVAGGESSADAAPGGDGADHVREQQATASRPAMPVSASCVLPACFLTVDCPTPPPNPSSHRQVLALAREGAKYGVLVVAAGAILMVKKVRGTSTRVQPLRARAGVHKQTLRPRTHMAASRR